MGLQTPGCAGAAQCKTQHRQLEAAKQYTPQHQMTWLQSYTLSQARSKRGSALKQKVGGIITNVLPFPKHHQVTGGHSGYLKLHVDQVMLRSYVL